MDSVKATILPIIILYIFTFSSCSDTDDPVDMSGSNDFKHECLLNKETRNNGYYDIFEWDSEGRIVRKVAYTKLNNNSNESFTYVHGGNSITVIYDQGNTKDRLDYNDKGQLLKEVSFKDGSPKDTIYYLYKDDTKYFSGMSYSSPTGNADVEFKWKNGNIIFIKSILDFYEITIEYDDKINPYYNVIFTDYSNASWWNYQSKNNIVKFSNTCAASTCGNETITYKYNSKGYPIGKTVNYFYGPVDNGTYNISYDYQCK